MQTISRLIAASGPMSIAQYMHLCHAHPEHGYYASGNPVGKSGDFITAPEVSQMFGELIAIWCISAWQAMGKPNPIQIAELGPGRGTLMQDFLRTIALDPEFKSAATIKMVESSPSLTREQQQQLAMQSQNIEWVEHLNDLDTLPTLFIANEFLDAIPFRQFIKTKDQWQELCIDYENDDKLTFIVCPIGIDEAMLPADHADQPDGAIFETAPAREAIAAEVAQHITTNGGAALFIDYGHELAGFGDTFQAVKSHKKASTLAAPGTSDLTSHVDFEAIATIATQSGAIAYPLKTQCDFLLELGLLERAGALGQGKDLAFQKQIQTDVERLASPEQMGTLFKVLCISDKATAMPVFSE